MLLLRFFIALSAVSPISRWGEGPRDLARAKACKIPEHAQKPSCRHPGCSFDGIEWDGTGYDVKGVSIGPCLECTLYIPKTLLRFRKTKAQRAKGRFKATWTTYQGALPSTGFCLCSSQRNMFLWALRLRTLVPGSWSRVSHGATLFFFAGGPVPSSKRSCRGPA